MVTVSHLLNWEAEKSVKVAYLPGSWETCGVLLIHADLPGYLCQVSAFGCLFLHQRLLVISPSV